MLQFGSNIFYFFPHRTFYFLFQGAEPSDNAYAGSLISQWRRVDKTLSGGKQVCCFPDADGIIFQFSIFILPVHLLCIWMAQLNLPVNCNVTKSHSGLSRTYYLNSRWGEVPTARCAGGGFHITDLLNNNEHNDMDKLFPMYYLLKNEIWHCTNYLPQGLSEAVPLGVPKFLDYIVSFFLSCCVNHVSCSANLENKTFIMSQVSKLLASYIAQYIELIVSLQRKVILKLIDFTTALRCSFL